MVIHRHALPNFITVGRIVLAPVVAALLFVPTFSARFLAWILFLVAAFSDLWDGYLARKHGWISDFGKLVDPIADKLLLVVTFVPFYILSHQGSQHGQFVVLGKLPLWIVLVIFGREFLITFIRGWAARRGLIIPAGKSGKFKAVFQNIFIGTSIAWLAAHSAALNRGWEGMPNWTYFSWFAGFVYIVSLVVAIFLTVFSLVVYLLEWRKQLRTL